MVGITDFIIEIKDPYKDKIEVGDIELYIDGRLSRDRAANRFGKIISCPVSLKNDLLRPGFEIIFDATILYKQIYKEGTQESVFLVDKEKSWYKINPDLIILWRCSSENDWKGYRDNLMVEYSIKESETEQIGGAGLILSPVAASKIDTSRAVIKFINEEAEAHGVKPGDTAYVRPGYGVPFYFKDQTFHWIRTKDLLAV
jgi:co-chaperonin GroES (HSP10)